MRSPVLYGELAQTCAHSQVVYGSDYPYVQMDTQASALTELGLEKNVLQQIQYKNADHLLKR